MSQQANDPFFRSQPAGKREQQSLSHHDHPYENSKSCFSCGHKLAPGADLCEVCLTWQLTDACCFCYTPFRPGQKFCSNCGDKPGGITCGQCGTHSHFDVCPKCSTPLSRRAKTAQQKVLEIPEFKQLEELLQPKEHPHRHLLDQLNSYGRNGEKEPTVQKPESFSFSSQNTDYSRQLSGLQQNDKEAIEKKLLELQQKTFPDNQAARLFYESIKGKLSVYKQCAEYLGWRCEYAYAVHYDGPSTCQCPTMGGRWICKDEVIMINQWEFILEGVHYKPRPETPRNPQTSPS